MLNYKNKKVFDPINNYNQKRRKLYSILMESRLRKKKLIFVTEFSNLMYKN